MSSSRVSPEKATWEGPLSSEYFHRDTFEANTDAERAILGLVFRRGPLTQIEITREIDRSQQTVSRLVSRLIKRGSLRQGERVSSGKRGQLSINVEIAPEYAFSFGVSIMTDAVAVALMDFSGKVLDQRLAAMTLMSHDKVVRQVRKILDELMGKWVPDASRIFGTGVGISGYFMRDTGRVNTPFMLEEWANINIEEVLSGDLGLPVWVENDGNAAAIGESLVGVGRWAKNFVYFYIAAGLGGGIILNGEMLRGEFGNAGELAQLLPPGVYPHPNLELLRQLIGKHGTQVNTVSELVASFDPGWPGVDEWIMRVRDSLSLIASAAAAILDPEVIVIGGRIPQSLAERIIPHIETFDQRRRSFPRPLPRIVAAEAEGDSAAIGAAALTFEKFFFR